MNADKVQPIRPAPTQDQNIANYIAQVLCAPSLSIPASEVDRLVASRAWLARIATGELVVVPPAPAAVGPGAVEAPAKAGGMD
jgi:hypothetical protein